MEHLCSIMPREQASRQEHMEHNYDIKSTNGTFMFRPDLPVREAPSKSDGRGGRSRDRLFAARSKLTIDVQPLTVDSMIQLAYEFLPGVPSAHVLERLAAAGGNEVGSGKLISPQSSAALAVNTFGWFVERPELLPSFPTVRSQEWQRSIIHFNEKSPTCTCAAVLLW